MKRTFLCLGFAFSTLLCSDCSVDKSAETSNNRPEEQALRLPPSAQAYLQQVLPGWKMVDTSDYINAFWSFYDKTKAPLLVCTDINDDQRADYSFIMRKGDSLRCVILLGQRESFKHWLSPNFIKRLAPNANFYGVSVEPPGRVDIAYPKIASLILKSNAINLMEYEVRNSIYYWDGNEIKVFETR